MGYLRKASSVILILSTILIMVLGVAFFRESEKTDGKPSEPVFSHESGMYENDILLSITADDGVDVYYTLDGSEPTMTSMKYTAPLNIQDATSNENIWSDTRPTLITKRGIYRRPIMNVDKATIIRAAAFSSDGSCSEVVTKTYFIGDINNSRYSDMPIVSLITNPYNLFDYNAGIYVLGRVYDDYMAANPGESFDGGIPANYNQRGLEWEREAHIEYFDSQGNVQVSQKIGIRIQGGFTRYNMQKSFSLFAREEYGNEAFDYDFFNNKTTVGAYKNLVLQTIEDTKYVDSYISCAAEELDMDTVTTSQPVVVFLDGEYWGVYSLRQSVSVDYLSTKYDIPADDILMAKADGYGNYNIVSGRARDVGYFNKMISFAENYDLSIDKNYEKICEMMDIQSFVEWIAVETYLGNVDCIKPGRPDNNVIVWRVMVPDGTNEYADGKWRWILFDTDKAIGYKYDSSYDDVQERLINQNDASHMQKLFKNLIVNDEFRELFKETYRKMGDTVFNQTTSEVKWKDFAMKYDPELERYYARFPTREPGLYNSFLRVNEIEEFFNYRPFYIENMLSSVDNYVKLVTGGSADE